MRTSDLTDIKITLHFLLCIILPSMENSTIYLPIEHFAGTQDVSQPASQGITGNYIPSLYGRDGKKIEKKMCWFSLHDQFGALLKQNPQVN